MPTDRPTKARTRDAAAVNGKWERRNGRRVNWGFHLGQEPAVFGMVVYSAILPCSMSVNEPNFDHV